MMHYPKNPPPKEFVGALTHEAYKAVKFSKKEGPMGRPRWSGWDKLLAALFLFTAMIVSIQTFRNCMMKANADFIVALEDNVSYIPHPLSDPHEPLDILNELDPFTDKHNRGNTYEVSLLNADFRGLRGGKRGDERGREFMTRGILYGDSIEEVHRILGEPDRVSMPGKAEVYYFYGDKDYLLYLEFRDQKLYGIKLTDMLVRPKEG